MSVVSPPQVADLPPTWFIGFRRARLWPLSASRPSSTDLIPPYALLRSLRPLRRADYRLAPVIVLPLWFFVFIVAIMHIVWDVINRKGGRFAVILLLLVFLYPISRQVNAIPPYTVLVLLRIWRLLIIPPSAKFCVSDMRRSVQVLRCRALTTAYSVSAVRG